MAQMYTTTISVGLELDAAKFKAEYKAAISEAQRELSGASGDVGTSAAATRPGSQKHATEFNKSAAASAASMSSAAEELKQTVRQQRNRATSMRERVAGAQAPGSTTERDNNNMFGSTARGDRKGPLHRIRSVAEYAVAATAIGATFGAFKKGISVVADVNQEMSQLNKVLDTSKAKLEDLKNAAIATAKEYGLSTKDVLKGYKIFAQQGLSPEEVKSYGKTVALASNVSEFGTEGLSELISAAKKIFPEKDTGKTGQRLIDTLLKVEGKYAVSESDLADVLKRIGAQGALAGMGVPELSALTTVMKERTRAPSGEIATSLRFMIKNLQDPKTMTTLSKAFERFGMANKVRFYDATGDLRNTFDVMKDIADIFPKLNRSQKTYVAGKIGETRFANKVISLMSGFGQTTDVLNVAQNASGATLERNAIVMESLGKQSKKTGAAFEAFALAFGDNFVQPAITFLKVTQQALGYLEAASKFKLFGGETPKAPGIGQSEQSSGGINVGGALSLVGGYLALRGVGKAIFKGATLFKETSAAVHAVATGETAVGMAKGGLGAGAVAGADVASGLGKVLKTPIKEAFVGVKESFLRLFGFVGSKAISYKDMAVEGGVAAGGWSNTMKYPALATSIAGKSTMYATAEGTTFAAKTARQATALNKLAKAATGTINEGIVYANEAGTTYKKYGKNLLQPGVELGLKAPIVETVARAGLGGAGIASTASTTSKGLKAAGTAAELLGKSFVLAVAAIKAVPKMLWSIFGSGSAFTKIFSKAGLSTVGMAGGPAGWAGAAASMVATDLAIRGIGKLLESGRGRSERQGLVQRQTTAQGAIDTTYALDAGFQDLVDVNEQIAEASKMTADQQKEAVKSGKLSGTQQELLKTKQATVEIQRGSLDKLATVIQSTPELQKQFEITSGGNIKYFAGGDKTQPGVDLRNADEATFKEATGRIRTTAEFDRALSQTGMGLNSLSENLENDESFKIFNKAFDKAKKRADNFGASVLDVSTEALPTLTSSFMDAQAATFPGLGGLKGVGEIPGLSMEEMAALRDRGASREQFVGGILDGFEEIFAKAPSGDKAISEVGKILEGTTSKNLDKFIKAADIKDKLLKKVTVERQPYNPVEQLGKFLGISTPRAEFTQAEVLKARPDEFAKFIASELLPERRAIQLKGSDLKTVQGTADIVQQLKSAQAGTVIKFKDDRGLNQFGKVVDINGQKMIRSIQEGTSISNAGTTKSISFVDRVLEQFGQSVKSITIAARPTAALIEGELGISDKTRLTGLGARKLEETSIKGGAAYLGELTDLMAGLYKGSGNQGAAFNTDLQDFFTLNSKAMEGITEKLKNQQPLTEDEGKQVINFEAVSLVAKEIESLGKIIKTLEGTFVQFQRVENQRTAQRDMPITTTGELRAFGGVAPKVELGKDLIDLSPLERAANAFPTLFENLARQQAQRGLMQQAYGASLDVQDTAMKALEDGSSQALERFNIEGIRSILQGQGVSAQDQEKGLGILNDITNMKDVSPERRENVLNTAREFFGPLLRKTTDNMKQYTDKQAEQTRPNEVAAKTAISLQALQQSAESASRTL